MAPTEVIWPDGEKTFKRIDRGEDPILVHICPPTFNAAPLRRRSREKSRRSEIKHEDTVDYKKESEVQLLCLLQIRPFEKENSTSS
jgi:hypothetical protein